MKLQQYHWTWLWEHPNRTERWLADKLSDGFHIHHLDGDHSNNVPDNLVLIDGDDHLRLHGLRKINRVGRSGPRQSTLEKGRAAYERRASGERWPRNRRADFYAAMVWAKHHGLPWPL